MKKIILLRRNWPSESEIKALQEIFSRKELHFIPTHPPDYMKHYDNCVFLKPDIVLLPGDQPIPSKAMKHGFRHVVFVPGKGLQELVEITVVFKPFNP